MRFMYMDECKSTHTNIVSLTAIVVDECKYSNFREGIYRCMQGYIRPEPGQNVYSSAPELHGSKLLPDVNDDDEKIGLFRSLAKVLSRTKSRIYRCGYYRDGSYPKAIQGDNALLSLAFFGIQNQAVKEYSDQLLLPVMDGVAPEIAKLFGVSNHSMHGFLACGMDESSISLDNIGNIADPVVSDSRYSVCTQCADMISYALHCQDWVNLGLQESLYKNSIVDELEVLKPNIITNEVILLNTNNVT